MSLQMEKGRKREGKGGIKWESREAGEGGSA